MRTLIIASIILFSINLNAASCLENMNAPANTIRNYYKDLKKKDITLLSKYFHGEEYRKLDNKTKSSFTTEDYDKHHFELLFGLFSVCRVIYKVECESSDIAIVTYAGVKSGTKFKGNESLWLHYINNKWLIGKKQLIVSSNEPYQKLIIENNIKCVE